MQVNKEKERIIQDIIDKMIPNYNELNEEEQTQTRRLVELYLDPQTTDEKRRLLEIQLMRKQEHLNYTIPNINPNDLNISRDAVNIAIKSHKNQLGQELDYEQSMLGHENPLYSLIMLCHSTNKAILQTQKEQQSILKALVAIQQQQIERELNLIEVIENQSNLLRELKESLNEQNILNS